MTDIAEETFEISTALSLTDYTSLILWHAGKVMLVSFVLFPAGMMIVSLPIRYLSFGSLEGWRYITFGEWVYVATVLCGGGAFIASFPLLFTIINWLRGSLPREIVAVISETGIRFPSKDVDMAFRWSNAVLVSKGQAAYFLRFGKLSVRLPVRAFSESARRDFERIVAASVPASANRLKTS